MKNNIILTMAGNYSRFRLFGNKIPKYLLPLGSGTVLSIIIEKIKESQNKANIFLIANRNDQIFFPIIKSIMKQYNISEDNIIYIDATSSQLQTAMFASEIIPISEHHFPVSFTNIDTVISDRLKFFEGLNKCKLNEGMIDSFNGRSNHYSYIRSEDSLSVCDIVDKKIISSTACSGLYGFGSFSFMKKYAETLLIKNSNANFTDLFKNYIDNSNQVFFCHSDNPNKTIVLGTPEEYVINIHRFK